MSSTEMKEIAVGYDGLQLFSRFFRQECSILTLKRKLPSCWKTEKGERWRRWMANFPPIVDALDDCMRHGETHTRFVWDRHIEEQKIQDVDFSNREID